MPKKKIIIAATQTPFAKGSVADFPAILCQKIRERNFQCELIQVPCNAAQKKDIYASMYVWRALDLTESNGEKVDLVICTGFPSYGLDHPNKVIWLTDFNKNLFKSSPELKNDSQEFLEDVDTYIEAYSETAFRNASLIFTLNNSVSDRLKGYVDVVSIPLFHPPRYDNKYFHAFEGDYILSVEEVDQNNRTDLLLCGLKKAKVPIKIKVICSDSRTNRLKEVIDKLDLIEQVELIDTVGEDCILTLYAEARAVYFAPKDISYPYTILEAFRARKSVMTLSDTCVAYEFISPENAFVSLPEEEAIAEVIQQIWEEPRTCFDKGCQGYRDTEKITWDHVIDCLTMFLKK